MDSCKVGIDIGSTTIKIVILNAENRILHKRYERHGSDVGETLRRLITESIKIFGKLPITVAMTGSGALALSEVLGVDFVQEVNAAELAVRHYLPDADTIIEIGGEDSKAVFLGTNGSKHKMNDTCAGGTGAYIDQMATLLETDAAGLNELAKTTEIHHGIASRCGVFAKSDIQPMINSGVDKAEIAKSIFRAIAEQVVGNLMSGNTERCHNVVFLGGLLAFCSEQRVAFAKRLPMAKVSCPDDAEYYIALGAAFCSAGKSIHSLAKILELIDQAPALKVGLPRLKPLFQDADELTVFQNNHKTPISTSPFKTGELLYLGIDSGSTTFKVVLINESRQIVWSYYDSNRGNVKKHMHDLSDILARLKNEGYNIVYSVAVGYGENLMIDNGLANSGEVETVAHLTAAKFLQPDVEFILDIGGQDMKGVWVRDGVVSKVQLNEACSSGCGSFIETYAKSLGINMDEFDSLACKSTMPVNLGSRCTVFMNSSIKQAQKEGIALSDIAAGLAYSVIHNALYKVFRISSADSLGKKIVVQGGTLINNSVLRAFELETGAEVIRPGIAGLMGAFGAALLALNRAKNPRLISRPVEKTETLPNLFQFKLNQLLRHDSSEYWSASQTHPRCTIGIPLALNMFENYPFWCALFGSLGYRVVPSDISDRSTYQKGLDTIFSGMVCYPAKLLHGHVVNLIEKGIKHIWMPFVKWEWPEVKQRNNFNCPVVMGYSHAVKCNMPILKHEGVTMHTQPVPYDNPKALAKYLAKLPLFEGQSKAKIKQAVKNAQRTDAEFKTTIRQAGEHALNFIAQNHTQSIVLAGHPYHIDPEINHGIPKMLSDLGVAVFTEDSIAHLADAGKLRISNQWVYHGRDIRAARFVTSSDLLNLVQLVSFGCGLDAVTSDQIQEILEKSGKIYTQLKIDEMSDLKPARIRARTLLFAIRERKVL